MPGEMVSVNDLLAGPHLWALQKGVGSNLDVTSGQAARVLALTMMCAGGDNTLNVDTEIRFYNSQTASGDFLRLRLDRAVPWSYTFLIPGGIIFDNGISIDVVTNDASDTGTGLVVYEID